MFEYRTKKKKFSYEYGNLKLCNNLWTFAPLCWIMFIFYLHDLRQRTMLSLYFNTQQKKRTSQNFSRYNVTSHTKTSKWKIFYNATKILSFWFVLTHFFFDKVHVSLDFFFNYNFVRFILFFISEARFLFASTRTNVPKLTEICISSENCILFYYCFYLVL